MAWTQTKRHLQLISAHPDLAISIIQKANLIESLLGMPLPDSIWDKHGLMPDPSRYPAAYHHDQRRLSYQERQEALYCGYRMQLTLLHSQAGLNIEEWLGQSLAIHWKTDDISLPSQIRHGIITEVIALGSNQGLAAYQVICEPALYQLRLNSHNRRHQHLSLSELITQIISPYDIDVEIDERLSSASDYHIQHSVQYNQTDLAYLTQYLALYGITGYYRHDPDKHTLVLLPHDSEALRPDNSDIHSILSQNPANLADKQDRITTIYPRVANHIQQSEFNRYDNRLVGLYSGSSYTEQSIETNSPSSHSRFLHSHSYLNDDGLTALATRYQQNAQQHANLGSLTGNIRHLSLPSSHYIDGNPYLTESLSLVSIHHQINNHIPADCLGTASFDPITLLPNPNYRRSNSTNNSGDSSNSSTNSDDDVHHIMACYLPFPHNHHIPYHKVLSHIGQPHPSLTGLMSASIIDTASSSAVDTDRNHRAHIRYHWEGEGSSESSAQWVPIAS